MSETGYLESCCWTFLRQYCPGDECVCRCHLDMPPSQPGSDRQTLLFVADDLRRVAEGHLKSADVAGKRIDRKHLTKIATVLLERARHYEQQAAAQAPVADRGA